MRFVLYIMDVGDALSQLLNVALLGGYQMECVSGRSYRLRNRSKWWAAAYRFINAIFFLQDDHCRDAHHNDIAMAAMMLKQAELTDAET